MSTTKPTATTGTVTTKRTATGEVTVEAAIVVSATYRAPVVAGPNAQQCASDAALGSFESSWGLLPESFARALRGELDGSTHALTIMSQVAGREPVLLICDEGGDDAGS